MLKRDASNPPNNAKSPKITLGQDPNGGTNVGRKMSANSDFPGSIVTATVADSTEFPQVLPITCKIPPGGAGRRPKLSVPIDDVTCNPAQGIGALVETLQVRQRLGNQHAGPLAGLGEAQQCRVGGLALGLVLASGLAD